MSKFDNVLIQSKQAAEENSAHHLSVLNERSVELRNNALIADRDFDGRRRPKKHIQRAPEGYVNLKTVSDMTGIHTNLLVSLIGSKDVDAKKFKNNDNNYIGWHIRLIDAQKLADQQRGV